MDTKKKTEKENALTSANIIVSADAAVHTAQTTGLFNGECEGLRKELNSLKQGDLSGLNEKLTQDSTFVGDRSKAVDVAYRYEAADVKMGGNGTCDWSSSQKEELLSSGKVRGYEGHHINSVAEHPELQTNPDNVRFYNGRQEHLKKGHNGNFRNSSSGNLIDRDSMLENTNKKRVLVNEALGVGKSVAFGAALGVVSSVYETCKNNGFNLKSVKEGVKKSGKRAATYGLTAAVTYGTVRVLSHFWK